MAWVRSQGKKLIIPFGPVCILERTKWPNGESLGLWDIKIENDPKYYTVGTFSTEEAAIEELDRIHDWIHCGAEGVWQVGKG